MSHPLHVYEEGLRNARRTVLLRRRDGTTMPLPLDRYLGPADSTDEQVVQSVRGPVLDVGCGPGRHLHALAARGVFALGVDLSPAAVELAKGRGARAVVASIFDELPGTGTWRSALLLDGNIGIGGAPARLLSRVGALLREDGEVLVELGAPGEPSDTIELRIESPDGVSGWFPWARVSAHEVDRVARLGGLAVGDRWSLRDRWFARLRRLPSPSQLRYASRSSSPPS